MASVLGCGVVVGLVADDSLVRGYFAITATVPIGVLLAGLEIHNLSDRYLARGGAVPRALRWLAKLGAPMFVSTFLLASGLQFTVSHHSLLVWLTFVSNWIAQELFRALIAVGRHASANFSFALRSGFPFALIAAILLLGTEVTFAGFLLTWAIFSGLAVLASILALKRHSDSFTAPIREIEVCKFSPAPNELVANVVTYLPAAITFRALLVIDVLVLASFKADADLIALAGVTANAVAAAYTLGDVAIIQWHYARILGSVSEADAWATFVRARWTVGAFAFAGTLGIMAAAIIYAVMDPALASGTILQILPSCTVLPFVMWSAISQIRLLSVGDARNTRRVYSAAIVCVTGMLAIFWFAPWIIIVTCAKFLGWAVLASGLLTCARATSSAESRYS